MNKELLDIYSDYLISQNQKSTATGLSKVLDGDISHDQITRFLNGKEFSSKQLWQYVKEQVRKNEEPEGALVFDDTIEEKPYTNENDTVCWHHSHTKKAHVKGVNILSGLIRYGDVSIPITFEIIRKDLCFCDLKDRKEKRRSSISKNELFRKMLCQSFKNKIMFKYVLADSWFGAKKNMEFIHHDLQKIFIFGMKSNRLVALSENDRKKGRYQKISSLDIKDKEVKTVWLKGLSFPVQLLKRVFTNGKDHTGTLYLVTNDLNIDASHIYSTYQKRWCIEEYHKSIKQNASLEKSPTKVSRSQRNHIFASIIGYCKLEFLKLKTAMNHFALKYKLIITANQTAYKELRKMRKLQPTA